MKNRLVSFLVWALALITMPFTATLSAAPLTKVTRTTGSINPSSPFVAVSFLITDAPPTGARYLIQARGLPSEKNGTRLDPEIILYGEAAGSLVPLAGNDDWRNAWVDGGLRTINPELASFQGITGALPLAATDSALAFYATNGSYTVIAHGWFNSTGSVTIDIHEINEAPEMSVSANPIAGVGEIPMLHIVATDPDGDDVELLFDTDGDGIVDVVSPRMRSGAHYWPTFVKFTEPGFKRYTVWARDAKGAVSRPYFGSTQVYPLTP